MRRLENAREKENRCKSAKDHTLLTCVEPVTVTVTKYTIHNPFMFR
jgi:hypothetical protein